MSRVAIVTDSASDLPPEVAAAAGITVVPLVVNFGSETFRPNVNLTTDEFWARMTAPDAPFPTTAAASPGDFGQAYQAAFDAGADAVVCVTVSGDLSGTLKSATLGAQELPDREIHVIDSRSASMGHGMLAQVGAEMAAGGATGCGDRGGARGGQGRASTCTWRWTRSSTSSAAGGSAARARRWARCSRSSRSSP